VATPLREQLLGRFAGLTNRFRVWYRLPFLLAMPTILGHRVNMREQNLSDTERDPSLLKPSTGGNGHDQRQADGSYTDLGCPWMGMAGARFGRNVPIGDTHGEQPPELYEPNPRQVSRDLLARRSFVPVPHLNVLVPAWLQFMVHDWLSHGGGDTKTPPHRLPLPPGDDWASSDITILRTLPDDRCCPADQGQPATYRNTETHWWDGSQIYGSDLARQRLVRTDPASGQLRPDGKIHLDAQGHLPVDATSDLPNLELSGVNGSWWVGLSVLHTLFAREHNAIVDRLRVDYPTADGEWLFQKARLVNAALIAKIHTVEWTPAILPNPLTVLALRTNWSGLVPGLQKVFPGLQDNELLSGIPGSPTDHHTAPYSLTEEFASVYRMHSLLPDEFTLWSAETGQELERFELPGLSGHSGRKVLERCQVADLFYSFGISHPGALRLHNFPKHLQHLKKDSGEIFDMAAVDILRDRERGVPRYNQFRRLFHKKPVTSFDELTDNPQWNEQIKRVYGGDLEKVDLLVGLMGEPLPEGFGFSDTAFRVFILMASRRLKSDRFLSQDYGPEMYTQAGIEWVEETSMLDVLRRHVPLLKPALVGVENAFKPWRKVG